MTDGSPASREISLDCSVALRFVFWTQQQRLNCDDVFISMRLCALHLPLPKTPADCSELHQQPVDAVLHPTFVLKLCYKLPTFLLRVLVH